MSWEKRGEKSYVYKYRRVGPKVRRIYLGTGAVGRFADAIVTKNRDLRASVAAAEREAEMDRASARAHTELLRMWCEILTSAVMLASGFRRPQRHTWRRWKDGQEALETMQPTRKGDVATRTGNPAA
jgi:hypothetical protein